MGYVTRAAIYYTVEGEDTLKRLLARTFHWFLIPLSLGFSFCSTKEVSPPFSEESCLPVECVDPFIGTGGGGFSQGNAFPGPSMPWGMVQPGPDTHGGPLGRLGFAHTAGYWYPDNRIEGFSQIHLHGTGIAEGGYITLMPTLGFSQEKTTLYGYAEPFSHSREEAEPGYYRVELNSGIVVELTATDRVAYHRYTFPNNSQATRVVILDLTHALGIGAVTEATLKVLDRSHLSGSLVALGEFAGGVGGFPLYFSLRTTPGFSGLVTWTGGGRGVSPNPVPVPFCEGTNFCLQSTPPFLFTQKGDTLGAALLFEPSLTEVEIRVGISYVDETGAEGNLRAEGDLAFLEARSRARKTWEELLGRIVVEGGTLAERRKFYTALYHTMLMPNLMSDQDGRYRGLDNRIAVLSQGRYYSNFSLWDTYRTLHPLLNLIAPEVERDLLRSLVLMAEALGYFPRWPLANRETSVMVGIPAHIVVSDSYLKGVSDFPTEVAYAFMVSDLVAPRRDQEILTAYRSYGYVPDSFGGSVALTLEYAHAVYSMGLFARALGNEQDARNWEALALRYRQLFDPKTLLFRPRDGSGRFSEPFSPDLFSRGYVEGNAWHYLYMAPWDPQGYEVLFGGRSEALKFWQQYFSKARFEPTPVLNLRGVEIEFPRNVYWPMNEPSLYAPLFGALFGDPDGSSKVIRWVMERFYSAGPDGIPGNDDGGTMSAWYVFSALGLFPIPGTDRYLLTGSAFPRIVLSSPTIRLEIRNSSPQSTKALPVFVGSRRDEDGIITHKELLSAERILYEE